MEVNDTTSPRRWWFTRKFIPQEGYLSDVFFSGWRSILVCLETCVTWCFVLTQCAFPLAKTTFNDIPKMCVETVSRLSYNVLHKVCPTHSRILCDTFLLFVFKFMFSTLCGMIPADFGFVEPEHAEHAGAGRGSTAGHAEPFLCSTRGRRSFQIFRSPCIFWIMWSQGSQPYDRVQYVYRVIYKFYIYMYICEIRWFQMTLGWFRSS